MPFGITVFKTAAFNRSAIPPKALGPAPQLHRAPLQRDAVSVQRLKRMKRISYNESMTDEDYMRLALEEARRAADAGEVPIGAVVVFEPHDPATRRPLALPRIVACAGNRRERDRDPAGHAEFSAMLQASRELDAWRLSGCTVYVTLEPCIMCAGLMHQVRIDRCVYGARDPKAGALGSLYRINEDSRLNHTFEVVSGALEEECADVLRRFFADRRKKR